MTESNDLHSLLSQLEELENSTDYLTIINTFGNHFHRQINELITKWIANEDLSTDETRFFDLYSKLQLSPVEYCLFRSDTTANIPTIIEQFPRNLFQRTSTDKLTEAVEYIREEHFNSRSEDDIILVYIMRMIDARSYAYRLQMNYSNDMHPRTFYVELYDGLVHRHGKKYLHDVKLFNETNEKIVLTNRHKFFLGCSTYAVALFPENRYLLKDSNEKTTKYINLLAKYVRVMLKQNHFEQNSSILYCLRGVLALLTNCVPTENWIHIINKALANPNDIDVQQTNPFNLDLFSSIVKRLLGSNIIHDKAIQSDSHIVTSLVDVALIFLCKWFGTLIDREDDEEIQTKKEEPSEVLQLLRLNKQFNDKISTSEIIFSYIDAKYDRLRFMSVAILSSLMSFNDLEKLKEKNNHIWKDIVTLIFQFIDQAVAHERKQYKGISFDLLLCYLYRFLLQDGVKTETVPYISQITQYATGGDLTALKVANDLFNRESKMYKYVQDIRENLKPIKPNNNLIPYKSEGRQAFISYSHDDVEQCNRFRRILEDSGLFTKIWVDSTHMEKNIIDSITHAIRQSEVVFVLLSDAYCQSSTCRREWNFADTYKKTVCALVVQESFKRRSYDWVTFLIETDLYYKLHDKNDVKHLLENLRKNRHKLYQNDRDNLNKQLIAEWTRDNVQSWCRENKLNQWCQPLAHYNGRDLLELNKVLKKDAYLHHVATSHDIPLLDVIKFRGELRKLISETITTTTPIISTKKTIIKRN
ncbi:hypothetical protein I4U23_006446 [Adineta vaga]|nr:hypothetical protein I4U23_006446 [Adineta vaga]